jgi:DNA-binding MarR family transcriptional regulator
MASVAKLLAMDRTTLTAALKLLQQRGLVNVARDAEDRRGRRLSLTDEGMDLLVSATPIWEQTHREIEAQFNEGETDRLRVGLQALSSERLP